MPDCVTMLTAPLAARPNSATPPEFTTWNSRITSSLRYTPDNPAASSFPDRPSTRNVLLRFRWPLMESPVPGTADVSAKRSVLRVLVREAPGVSRARSR